MFAYETSGFKSRNKISILVGWLITRSITVPLQKSVRFVQEVLSGNLTYEIEMYRKDEIGMLTSALRDMARELRSIILTQKYGKFGIFSLLPVFGNGIGQKLLYKRLRLLLIPSSPVHNRLGFFQTPY